MKTAVMEIRLFVENSIIGIWHQLGSRHKIS